MSPQTLLLVKAAHVIAIVLWVSGLSTIFWMLRFHDHAPASAREPLSLMERSIAMSTDITAALAIVSGIVMSLSPVNLWTMPNEHWLHVKVTAVVVGILSTHGILRARIKRYSRGDLKPVPMWVWSLFLGCVAIAIFCVMTRLEPFGI